MTTEDVHQVNEIAKLMCDLRLTCQGAISNINYALTCLNTLACISPPDAIFAGDRMAIHDMRAFLADAGRMVRAAHARNPAREPDQT
jgi:hypothetical protein